MADWKNGIRRVLYPAYERRMLRHMPTENLPKHVGVMLDGNRRWARAVGASTAHGHRAGAANIEPLLGWCEEVGIEPRDVVAALDRQPEPAAATSWPRCSASSRRQSPRWPTSSAGGCTPWEPWTCCRQSTAEKLKAAAEATRDIDGLMVNVAVGYGGRREIADAVRSLLHEQAGQGKTLEEVAEVIDVEHIAAHLYTRGQPDPDLVIRTSGEQRLGGFLLWQSTHSRVLLLRGLLARLPSRRLPAGDPGLRPARTPLRQLIAVRC